MVIRAASLASIVLAACGGRVDIAPAAAASDADAPPDVIAGDAPAGTGDAAPGDGTLPPPGDGLAVLSTLASNSTSLAIDALHLYWSTDINVSSSVMTVPKAGGPTTSFPTQPYAIYGVAVDTSRVYWTDTASIWACDVSGCGWPTAIVSIPTAGVVDLTSDGVHVLFTGESNGMVMMCPVSGCNGLSPTTLAANQGKPIAVASDGTTVFWTTTSAVMACTIADCSQTTIVLASKQKDATALALDATTVYWAATQDGRVMSCAKQGCADAPLTIATGQVWPVGVAVDDTAVYWTESGAGNVDTCPKTGCTGSPTRLATGQSSPWPIVVDDNNLYWINRVGGTVMRLEPK